MINKLRALRAVAGRVLSAEFVWWYGDDVVVLLLIGMHSFVRCGAATFVVEPARYGAGRRRKIYIRVHRGQESFETTSRRDDRPPENGEEGPKIGTTSLTHWSLQNRSLASRATTVDAAVIPSAVAGSWPRATQKLVTASAPTPADRKS